MQVEETHALLQTSSIYSKQCQWALGIIFIVLVAIIWTFASVLVQYIFQDAGFSKPFFLTYIATSLFSINLPIWYLCRQFQWVSDVPIVSTAEQANLTKTIAIAKRIAPIWFIANFTYNQSLQLTSVTSSTVISSTSSIFTFGISVYWLQERVTWSKVVGVLCCVFGNIATVYQDHTGESGHDSAFGDMLAIAGALFYGIYTVAIRKYCPTDDYMSIPLFFGFLGLYNAVCLFPVVVVLHWSGWESLDGLNWTILGLLVVKGLFDNVLSDYLWARAMILTSPTVATIGLSLTIPMALLSDLIFHQVTPAMVTYIAAFLVITGFVLMNLATKPQRGNHKSIDMSI